MKIGEKSMPPNGGTIFLTGAITGSVSCQMSRKIGCGFTFPENSMTNDMMIEPIIAYQYMLIMKYRTPTNDQVII